MKVTASTKTIIILLLSFFLLVLGAIFLLNKDIVINGLKYNRWYRVDRYDELLKDCEFVKEKDNLDVKCKALLTDISRKDINADACFTILQVPKEKDSKLEEKKVCEVNQDIEWVNPYDNYIKKIPINIFITYKKENIFKYTLSKVKFDVMSDEESVILLEEYSKVWELQESIERKYYDKDMFEGVKIEKSVFPEHYYKIQEIGFYRGIIEEVNVEGEFMVVRIRTRVRDKEVVLVSRVRGFDAISLRDGKNTLITVDNIDKIPKGTLISPSYYHLTEKLSSEKRDDLLNNICKMTEPIVQDLYGSLCANIDVLESGSRGELDVESFLSLFDGKDLNNINFNDVGTLFQIFHD